MADIDLGRGYVAIVDDEDLSLVSRYNWNAQIDKRKDGTIRNVYAQSSVKIGGSWTVVQMHRLILGLTDGRIHVDHINHNGLDNRRPNLRACTPSQNAANRRNTASNTSGFKGVSWHCRQKRWLAMIRINGKRLHLGCFHTRELAADAYIKAAIEHFGEFATFFAPKPEQLTLGGDDVR